MAVNGEASRRPQSYKYDGALNMQRRTRTERNFEKTESDLSGLSSSTSSKSSSSKPVPQRTVDKFRDALSYFGHRNPLPRSIGPEDEVWLLDNTAYRSAATGKWEAEYVAAMFSDQMDESCSVIDVTQMIATKLGLDDDDPNLPTLQQRARPFLQDIKPGASLKAVHGGRTHMKLGPGGRNGIATVNKRVQSPKSPGQLIPTVAEVPKATSGLLEMQTFYAEPEGWGVISDIDDTIKITQTSDPIGILRTTFIDNPEVCAGMPELYRNIAATIRDPAPWFYLSSSPYNLYPFLRQFRDDHYPHGTIILRDQSWMNISGLLSNLTLGTEDYKVDRMEKIHGWLPKRKMICIGDSTQSDPESYGEIYRKFPGWVHLILIRRVDDIAAVGIDAKNEPERFETAFKDVPREAWHVFEDPAECDELVRELVAGGGGKKQEAGNGTATTTNLK